MTRTIRLAPAIALICAAAATPASAQDADAGAKVFQRCMGCHAIGDGATNRVGPVLTGVVGRPAGSYEGYKYSDSMKAAGAAGLVWTRENIFAYLAGPTPFLRDYLGDPNARARMTFHIADEQDRRDVIAHLATFSTADAGAGADAPDTDAPETNYAGGPLEERTGQVCVRNASEESLLFAVETPDTARKFSALEPGEELCAAIDDSTATGIASVYNDINAFEGCTSMIPAGHLDELLRYLAFDRCFWTSNS